MSDKLSNSSRKDRNLKLDSFKERLRERENERENTSFESSMS